MKLNKKKVKKNPEEEDYDFDMSMYEAEEKDTSVVISIKNNKKPRITNLRSKYSPSAMDLENLSNIKIKISQCAIKVAAFTQDLCDLWDLYGCLNEYWARIHDIYGTDLNKEVKLIKKKCEKKLMRYGDGSSINHKTHKYLLYFRDKVYMIAQRSNLGLEVERVSYTSISKAVRGIKE